MIHPLRMLMKRGNYWKHSFRTLRFTKTVGAKHHYLNQQRMLTAHTSEQSVGSLQKVCQLTFDGYKDQRGVKRL